ncbi:response regulator transcription factor [Geodermatophilus sp. SYSU D00758]
MPGGTVLVVEDEAEVRTLLRRGLEAEGFTVVTAADGRGALAVLDQRAAEVDAVVLDVGLGDSDGLEVCQAIRSRGIGTPVLFLTSHSRLPDVLAGFAAGADDHIAKPFALDEVVVRLRAVLRRAGGSAPSAGADGLHLDPHRRVLAGPGGDRTVTPIEFRLLAALLGAAGAVVPRRDLVTAGWPAGGVVHDNTLDQYLSRLRRKVATTSEGAVELRTVHGVGYRAVVSGEG